MLAIIGRMSTIHSVKKPRRGISSRCKRETTVSRDCSVFVHGLVPELGFGISFPCVELEVHDVPIIPAQQI